MATEIDYNDVEKPVAVGMGETKETHGAEIHSHHCSYQCRLAHVEEVLVGRNNADEGTAAKVEDVAFGVVVEIWHKAKEERQAKQRRRFLRSDG